MVRMLYQNGDKVLNTVNDNKEPFYMQLEALMRRENSEKKMPPHENGQTERLQGPSNGKPVVFPQVFMNHAQNGSKKHSTNSVKEPISPFLNFSSMAEPKNSPIVNLFSKPFDVFSTHALFPKSVDTTSSGNGSREMPVMDELITRQMNILKRQEELQRRAELLYEKQMARETRIEDSVASLGKAASHLEQIGEFLLNACRYASLTGGTFSPNNNT
ncbi:unnamed protein product [Gongylonema pulchrum]|uniref:Ovule protein n=1 Tax=Gongylonema pulchrum TaxID=637853 RepID=A0A183DNM2_9BILA|nr:unnamed protein product [Gongylonema pulchrum]